ncbi:MAG: autotransporter-associated beta strand repeat-containing protein [Verrucomicrobia bacterium]|nr:autotransporter-associated beta strand repeat-containing protein [Verrucomicrobiota bacterium]
MATCVSLVLVLEKSFAASYAWDGDAATPGLQDGSGWWTNANWSLSGNGSDDGLWVDGSAAVFGGGSSGTANTIVVGNGPVVGNLTFNAPFAGSYTLMSSTLTLTNGPTITVNSGGNAVIASSLRGDNGFIKTGPGTLSVTPGSANSYAGLAEVAQGTLIEGGGSGKVTICAGGVLVDPGATLQGTTGKTGTFDPNASITNNGGTILWGCAEISPVVDVVLRNNGVISNYIASDRNLLASGTYRLESGTIAYFINADGTTNRAMALNGTAGLTKTTSGTVYILGTNGAQVKNAYTGITTLSGGILNIGWDRAIGAIPAVFTDNQLTLDGGTLQINHGFTWSTNRGVALTANGGTLDILSGVSQTIPVVIAGGAGGVLTKAGAGTLTLTGVNTCNGNTIISAGTLALSGNGSIAGSPNITVAGNATFDVSALTTPLILENSQTLTASGTAFPATIGTAAGAGLTLGATSPLQFTVFTGASPPLTITGGGTMGLNAGNVVTVTVAHGGTPLPAGDYKLISQSASGGVTGVAPTSVIVNGDGVATGENVSLFINAGELYLHVGSGTVVVPANNRISLSGGAAIISVQGSPSTEYVLQTTTNLLGGWLPLQTNTTDGNGGLSFTNANATKPQQFYRTVH